MSKPSAKKLDVSLPLRVTSDMHAETKHASKMLGKGYQDTHREATEIGLRFLREIDWDITGSIVETAARKLAKKNGR